MRPFGYPVERRAGHRTGYLVGALAVATLLAAGCFPHQGPSTHVQRTNPNAQVDLSGNWNDTDANQVSQAMIRDCLGRPWASRFKAEKGRDPVVKLYPIRNRSSDHINTKFFTKQVEMELINSGTIKVVAASDEVGDAREEKTDQAHHASDATAKQHRQETGTDFLLNGWIISQNDAAGGQEVRAYVTTMELINVETQQKVWIGLKKIKKIVTRAASEW